MPGNKNYYKELGVPRNASVATIEEAWKQWKRDPNNHPDTHPDPHVKARVESEFQERSAAYLILSNPVDRRRHDADLRAREAADKKPSTSTQPSQGFDGPDPASEEADWGDEPAVGRQSPPSYSSPPPPAHSSRNSGSWFGKVFRYSPFMILAIVGVMVLLYIAQHMINPTAATGGTIDPQSSPSQSSDPGVASVATPTPSPRDTSSPPSSQDFCPVGSPEVTIFNVVPGATQNSGSAQESYTYTITGKISNPTSAEVEIGGIGFYIGQFSTSTPPSWTDTLSNMATSPESSNPNDIPADGSVSFTEQHVEVGQADPQAQVSASLDYPSSETSARTANWSWIGETSDCTSPSQ